MKPVLRVVMPSISLTADTSLFESSVTVSTNTDYITEDMTPPLGALYVAKMDTDGKTITVLTPKSALLTPTHTYLGWPIPA